MTVTVELPPFLRDLEDAHEEKLRASWVKAIRLHLPRNDDELWHMMGHRFGRWYARRPVCRDHETPFDFLRMAYFEHFDRLLAMAAAGTGKTQLFADLHLLNSETRPGTWTAHVGAIEKQANRCADYLEQLLKDERLIGHGVEPMFRDLAIDGQFMRSMTRWMNGSRVEMLTGTINQVSGPHPHVGAMDEFELVKWEVWEHFSKKIHEGPHKRAQIIVGSTRFKAAGPMQKLIDEKQGVFRIVSWCVYDAMQRCNRDCNDSGGIPGFDRCPLWSRNEVQPDGTLAEVPMCAGKAHFANGHLTWDEVVGAYVLSDHDTWASLMELRKPSSRGLYFPEFDDRIHVSEEYEFNAEWPVYLGYDEGFNFPMVLGMFQMRPDGLWYQFDELYAKQTLVRDAIELIEHEPWVEACEEGWPDPTALGGIEEWRRWFTARLGKPVMRRDSDNDRISGWRTLRRRLRGVDGRASIGWHPRCSRTIADIKGLVRKEGTEDCEKKDDHGADMNRYAIVGVEALLGIRARPTGLNRPGRDDREEKARMMRREHQIETRWDALVEAGLSVNELRLIEQRFGARRDDMLTAFTGLLHERTIAGRLERAGLGRRVRAAMSRAQERRPNLARR